MNQITIMITKNKSFPSHGTLLQTTTANPVTNAVKNLNISIDPALTSNADHVEDPINKAIEKYKNHPSIVKIK